MKFITSLSKDINNLDIITVAESKMKEIHKMISFYPALIHNNNIVFSHSIKLLKILGFVENIEYNVFIHPEIPYTKNTLNDMGFKSSKEYQYIRRNNNISYFDYKYIKDEDIIKNEIRKGSFSKTDIITEQKGYSFGVEIETSAGRVPEYIAQHLNFKTEYDGSIRHERKGKAFGGEYVTGVLRGDSGFIQLSKILRVLNTRCEINKTCSVHVHVGGFEFDKATIVALWQILYSVQKEIFKMFPRSRRNNDHCSPISNNGYIIKLDEYNYHKSVEDSYSNIVKIITKGKKNGQTINKKICHPAGRNFGYDRSTPRYWWINFVPTLFSISGINGHTIEIRIHNATLNYYKIRNLVLLMMGIVHFAENNKRSVARNEFNIYTILESSFPNKGKYLSEFYRSRKKLFKDIESDTYNENQEYKERVAVPIKFKELL